MAPAGINHGVSAFLIGCHHATFVMSHVYRVNVGVRHQDIVIFTACVQYGSENRYRL
jgi:hypothetical protein